MAQSGSLTFLSASQAVASSVEGGTSDRTWYNISGGATNAMHTSFVGLNNVIVDPITGSKNTLGYPLSSSDINTDVALAATGATDTQYLNRAHIPSSSYDEGTMSAVAFNALMLHRNGPYQHPSWKQIRGGEHPVARRQRLNNTMSIDINSPDPIRREKNKKELRDLFEKGTLREINRRITSTNLALPLISGALAENPNLINSIPIQYRPNKLEQFYEPAVDVHHKPMLYTVNFSSPVGGAQSAIARSSMLNQMEFFHNEKLNRTLKIAGTAKLSGNMADLGITPRKQEYYSLLNAAKQQFATRFIYSQTVFPRKINTFRKFTLEIPEYDEISGLANNGYDRFDNRTFWRNAQAKTFSFSVQDTPIVSGSTLSTLGVVTFNGVLPSTTASSDGTTRTRTDKTAQNARQNGAQDTKTQYLWLTGTAFGTESQSDAGSKTSEALNGVNSLTTRRVLLNSAQVAAHATAGRWNATLHFIEGGIIAERGNNTVTGSKMQIASVHSSFPNSSNVVPMGSVTPQNNECNRPYVNLESYNPYPISLLSMWPLDPRPDIYPGLMSRPAAAVVRVDFSAFGAGNNRISITDASGQTVTLREGTNFTAATSDKITANNLTTAINASSLEVTAETNLDASTEGHIIIYQKTDGPAGNSDQNGNVTITIGDAGCMTLLQNFAGGFNTTPYLTSAFGSRAPQIGLTPHRMKLYDYNARDPSLTTDLRHRAPSRRGKEGAGITGSWPDYQSVPLVYTTKPVFEQAFSSSFRDTGFNLYATASYLQLANLLTGTAGELVYSTKPTLFLPRLDSTTNVLGYVHATASLQYNRHTFPYNTPFYATNRIRSRNPFFDSYSEFEENLDIIGREYSIIPEYRVSDHVETYYENYFLNRESEKLHVDVFKKDTELGHQKRKILRRYNIFKPSAFQPNTPTFKLDFLRIDGLPTNLSSSSNVQSLVSAVPSTTKYFYDHLHVTTSLGTTRNEIQDISYAQVSSSVLFNEKYSHFEAVEMSHLIDSPFLEGKNSVPTRISFNVHALKKLLPKKDFYPVLKTVEIGNKFKNFLSGTSHATNPEAKGNLNFSPYRFTESLPQFAMQTFLEPMCAPGILYNSIKSGIAVDYPIYDSLPAYHAPLTYFSGAVAQGGNIHDPDRRGLKSSSFTDERFTVLVTNSFSYGGFAMMGASRCIPAILNRAPSHRLPFEALYNLDYLSLYSKLPIYLTSDFIDLDYSTPSVAATASSVVGNQHLHHPGAAFIDHTPGVTIENTLQLDGQNKINRFVYEASVNNFLSETMEFFLADQEPGVKLPIAISERRSAGQMSFEQDYTYFMEVSLRMGRHHISCEGPRSSGMGGGGGRVRHEQAPMMQRGYIYGPPIEIVQMSGSQTKIIFADAVDPETGLRSIVDEPYISSFRTGTPLSGALQFNPISSPDGLGKPRLDGIHTGPFGTGNDSHVFSYSAYLAVNLQDPAYQAYTPPYFYGPSSLIMKYKLEDPLDQILGLDPANAPNPLKPSVTDIWGTTQKRSFYVEEYITGSRTPVPVSTYSPQEYVTSDMLCKIVPGTSSISGQGNVRMKIGASIDIFDNVRNNAFQIRRRNQSQPVSSQTNFTTEYMWYIAPKWIAPVLDFSSSFSSISVETPKKSNRLDSIIHRNTITNTFHDETTGRGLWGGYGTDPYDPISMKIVNQASGKRTNLNENDMYEKGIYFSIKFPFYGEQNAQDSAAVQTDFQTGVVNQFNTARKVEDFKSTGSLVTALGFQEKEYEIGKMAAGKSVQEAVVIIPYLDEPIRIVPKKSFEPVNTSIASPFAKAIPAAELYSTREIIPGKHFLPIHKTCFENLLSMKLVLDQDYIESELSKEGDNVFNGFESQQSIDAAKETDIYNLILTLMGDEEQGKAGFELPPELNFIDFKIDPFQMFVVPIEHVLEKQELIDIYQGIMPDSSLKLEKISSKLNVFPNVEFNDYYNWIPEIRPTSHGAGKTPLSDLGLLNFMSSLPIIKFHADAMNNFASETDSFVTIENSKDFYSKIKFMTFKIKQKSKKDYDRYRRRQIARSLKRKIIQDSPDIKDLKYDFSSVLGEPDTIVKDVFGYNWPYDNMSIIHSVKLDIEMEID